MLTRATVALVVSMVAFGVLSFADPPRVLVSLALAAIVIACGWAILEVAHGGVLALSATTFFFSIYVVYVAIPAVGTYAFLPDPLGASFWLAPGDKLVVSMAVGLVAFTCGSLLASVLFGTGKLRSAIRRQRFRFLVDDTDRGFWLGAVVVLGVALVGTAAFFYLNRQIYIDLLAASQIGHQRQSIRAGQGYLVANFVYLLPWISFLGVLVTIAWRKRNRRAVAAIITLGLVALAFLAQAALLYRGNLVFYLFGFVVLAQALRFGFSRRLVLGLAAVVVLLVATTATRLDRSQESRPVLATLQKIEHRFVTPMKQLAYVIDTRPSRGFFPGQTFLMDIAALAPGHQMSFNGLIYKEMGNYGPGSATITIVGEGFANLGLAGVAIELFVLGLALQAATAWYVAGEKTVIRTFVYLVVALYGGKTVMGGVTQYALQPAVILGLVSAWIAYKRILMRSLRRRRHASEPASGIGVR